MEIKDIEANKALKKILLNFIDVIIADKKLSFPINEYSFDNCLVGNHILNLTNDKYEIVAYNNISYYILVKYKEMFEFKTNLDFKENTLFLKKIDSDFKSLGYVSNYNVLEKYFWKRLIKESNHLFSCNFNDYLNSLNKENNSDEIFLFIECYSLELTDLKLSVKSIYENAVLLLEFSKSDTTYNLSIGNILNGIKEKCKNDYSLGLELFDFSFSRSVLNDNIISSIVSCLFDRKKEKFYNSHLKSKIENEINLNAIFFGLSNISVFDDSICERFIQFYDKYENNKDLVFSLSSLLISILKSKNSKYYKECFDRIIVSIKTENTAKFCLDHICYLENLNNEKSDLLVRFIGQEYFTVDNHLQIIGMFFWYIKDIDSFRKVIFALVEKAPFEPISKVFKSHLTDIDKIKLDKLIIELLIDNQARRRYLALDLFDELSSSYPYEFSFDILSLEAIDQYKLWVSLTLDFREPKYRITSLLPLIDSKSHTVKDCFIYKLEEISRDYGGHVLEVLKTNLDKENSHHTKVINRISEYISSFYKTNADVKNAIKELNPYYSQNKSFKKFNSLFRKKMSTSINKGAGENSIMSVLGVNTVKLSKGGGWKFEDKDGISQLAKIETSMSLPRSYFISPNDFEIEIGLESKMDWSDFDFEIIKNFIDNE